MVDQSRFDIIEDTPYNNDTDLQIQQPSNSTNTKVLNASARRRQKRQKVIVAQNNMKNAINFSTMTRAQKVTCQQNSMMMKSPVMNLRRNA